MLRATVASAIVASAFAFAPSATPSLRQGLSMQMDGVSRREAIQTAVAGAALLTSVPAFAQQRPGGGYPVKKKEVRMANANYAPVITVFDHRGCAEHVNKEYTGPKSGDENDEMVVEVKQTKFNRDNPKFIDMAEEVYRESFGQMYQYPIRDTGYNGK